MVASLSIAAALLGWIAWESHKRQLRREELMALRAAIHPGMSREDVVRIIKAHVRRTVFQDDEQGPLLCVAEAKYLGAWILTIRLKNGRAGAVYFGDYDNIFRAPRGAPGPLVWDSFD